MSATTFTLPAVATRAEVKTMIAELRADVSGALAIASTEAARQNFVATCYAIATQRAVFGSRAIHDAIIARAKSLPEYKVTKAGLVKGRLGQLIHAYSEALAVGASLADQFPQAEDECKLALLGDSPTFAALIAPPAAAPAAAAPAAAPAAAAPAAAAPAAAAPAAAAPAAAAPAEHHSNGNESGSIRELSQLQDAEAAHDAAHAGAADARLAAMRENARALEPVSRADQIRGAFAGMSEQDQRAILAELCDMIGVKFATPRKRA